jgi:plastocyanin
MRKAAVFAVAATVAVTAVPALAATTGVSVKDNKFVSSSVTIHKGSAVRWTWKGRSPHNVTVTKGPVHFRSGTKKKGTFTHTFRKRGTYRIVCTIHAPDMKMTVTVK